MEAKVRLGEPFGVRLGEECGLNAPGVPVVVEIVVEMMLEKSRAPMVSLLCLAPCGLALP